MLGSLFILIIGMIATAISSVLGLVSALLPVQFLNSIEFFTGYLKYANGIIDLAGMMQAIIWFLVFIGAWFTFKSVVWLWSFLFHGAHKDQALPAANKNKH